MANKPAVQQFTSAWNKAAAWASSQGIPQSSYLPVYKMDYQRVKTGYWPMSAGERNRAILAAHNPNVVTPTPTTSNTDLWTPSAVWHHTVKDAGDIFTGLINLPTGLFDEVRNTMRDALDPSRLKGPTLGATIGNLLDTTLLNFLPGAADVGRYLQAGGGMAGIDKLMENPLLSALDVLPAELGTGVMAHLAETGAGAELAARAGMTTDQLANSGFLKVLKTVGLNTATKKIGVAAGGGAVKRLTVGDVIQNFAQSKVGVSGPIGDMMQAYSSITLKGTAVDQSIFAPAMDAVMGLSEADREIFDRVFTAEGKGVPLEEALKAPDSEVPQAVKEALRKTWTGPRRFNVEEAIAWEDVTVVRDSKGNELMYSADQHSAVVRARKIKQRTLRAFVKTLDPMHKLSRAADEIESTRPVLADRLDQANQAARTAAQTDEAMLENIPFEVPGHKAGSTRTVGLPKRDMALKVFGEGGMVDQAVGMLREGNVDQLGALVPVLKRRLSAWGAHSVLAEGNKAFEALSAQVDALGRFVEHKHRVDDEITKLIYGSRADVSREASVSKDFAARQTKNLKANHKRQLEAISGQKATELAGVESAKAIRVEYLTNLYAHTKLSMQDELARVTKGVTPAEKGVPTLAASAVKQRLYQLRRDWQQSVRMARVEAKNSAKRITDDAREVERKARLAQGKELAELKDTHAQMADWHGQLMREMNDYAKALEGFDRAVWDHRPDNYRTVYVALYLKHLVNHERSAELIDATEADLKKRSGWGQDRVDALHENPRILVEMIHLFARDVYHDPTASPDMIALVDEVEKEVDRSAIDELQTLRARGFNPPWMPTGSSLDSRDDVMHYGVHILAGKGVPTVDAAKARAWDLTAKRHDVMIGLHKNLKQVLDRDATVEFAEHYLAPLGTTGRDLEGQIKEYFPVERLNPRRGTTPDYYEAQAESMGLVAFHPEKLFGFTLPRWQADTLYLPASLVKALNLLVEKEQFPFTGLYTKATGLFRYSVLNLSPRYTAHITVGGTMLLALKSSPTWLKYMGRAWRGIHDGSLPIELDRTPTTQGFVATAYEARDIASGKQLAWLGVQEHIERTQGVRWAAAKAVHVAKALGDLNGRFTRLVVHMQGAVAFLDGMARAEGRGEYLDPVTGRMVTMTRERAMVEGMHHADSVLGNLGRMAPVERRLARKIMPFYGWTKHILKYVLMFPVDHPWRAMVLSQIAFNASADVSPALYTRMQFLFFLGKPGPTGAVSAITDRFADPLRDVANYGTLAGWFQALNPAIMLPLVQVFGPQAVYGSTALYPGITYNSFYGTETATSGASPWAGVEEFVPETGALQEAIAAASATRSLAKSNPNAFAKKIFESLNIPFAQVQSINVRQIAAKDEEHRYEIAKQAATTAWQSGNFGLISGYKSVPDPQNPDYEITPAELEAIYHAALAEYPTLPPSEVLAPLSNPPGY